MAETEGDFVKRHDRKGYAEIINQEWALELASEIRAGHDRDARRSFALASNHESACALGDEIGNWDKKLIAGTTLPPLTIVHDRNSGVCGVAKPGIAHPDSEKPSDWAVMDVIDRTARDSRNVLK